MSLLSAKKEQRPTHEQIIANEAFLDAENLGLEVEVDDTTRNANLDKLVKACSLTQLRRQVQE